MDSSSNAKCKLIYRFFYLSVQMVLLYRKKLTRKRIELEKKLMKCCSKLTIFDRMDFEKESDNIF